MENFLNQEKNKKPNEYVCESLGLTKKTYDSDLYMIRTPEMLIPSERVDTLDLDNLVNYFEDHELIENDNIVRPKNSTTFFTTAGVQKTETIINNGGVLDKMFFICPQPVIRSQFMDKVTQKSSSSFVNLSAVSVGVGVEDYIYNCKKLIGIVLSNIEDFDKIDISLEHGPDRWGDRKFERSRITVYYLGVELGECVFIHDYPVDDVKKVAIVDLGFGIERMYKGLEKGKYMIGFNYFYEENCDLSEKKINEIIDPIRSMVLIAGNGIKGSNSDHGYRLRQFSKRFVLKKVGIKLDEKKLIHTALKYWKGWRYKNSTPEDEIVDTIILENDRNYNMLFLDSLKKEQGIELKININQNTESFLEQIKFSLKENQISDIIKIIYER